MNIVIAAVVIAAIYAAAFFILYKISGLTLDRIDRFRRRRAMRRRRIEPYFRRTENYVRRTENYVPEKIVW